MTDYSAIVSEAIRLNKIDLLSEMAFGRPCACHRREGEPKCYCQMLADEVRRQVIPSGLKRGLIIPIKK